MVPDSAGHYKARSRGHLSLSWERKVLGKALRAQQGTLKPHPSADARGLTLMPDEQGRQEEWDPEAVGRAMGGKSPAVFCQAGGWRTFPWSG
jgi:hypothetical protein